MIDVQVHMRHVRRKPPYGADLCSTGTKAWFAAHGLDFRSFLANGLPASVLEALNDELANRVVAVARKEHADMQEPGHG